MVSSCLLDDLTRVELGLDLGGSNWVVTSVKHVQLLVEVLRDGDSVESAGLRGLLVTSGGDGRQVNWRNRLDAMEVIVVDNRDVLVVKETTHHDLSVLISPVVSVEAGWDIRVLSCVTVAGVLKLIAALHLNTLDQRSKDRGRVVGNLIRVVTSVNLLNEIDNSSTELLSSASIVEIWDKILLLDGAWSITSHITHVRGTFKGEDGEHVLLSILDVDLRVPVGLCQTGDTHETILGSTEGKGGNRVVKVSGTVVIDRVVATKDNGTHQELTLDSVSVAVGVSLGHNTTERVTSEHDVVTSEAGSAKLVDSLGHVVVNKDRLRGG